MAAGSEEKARLRSRIKALRKAVGPEEKRLWDQQLKERFFALLSQKLQRGLPQNSILIYLYLDIRNEAGTWPILEELWKQGIRTAVPRVEGSEIVFYEIADRSEVMEGCMGILEPVAGLSRAEETAGIVLVPGVAFDPFGGRMGYGGGFYDRFFQREPDHPRWGLSYDFQIVEAVPQEPWDRGMDLVITPGGVWRGGKKED